MFYLAQQVTAVSPVGNNSSLERLHKLLVRRGELPSTVDSRLKVFRLPDVLSDIKQNRFQAAVLEISYHGMSHVEGNETSDERPLFLHGARGVCTQDCGHQGLRSEHVDVLQETP